MINPNDNSVLCWIPGGTFVMGSTDGDEDERPPHQVTLRGFWLGKYEVTNEQYARFLEATGNRPPLYWQMEGYDDPQQPVVGVTWLDAARYCQWAGLRLPTEEEWEYAASAGRRQLMFGTATGQISHDLANFQGTDGQDKWSGPAPVGRFPPNPFGLYDMAGNAWEWTSSLYLPYQSDRQWSDPQLAQLRVMRGGCWHFPAEYCRTAHRHRFAAHLTLDFAGFRVAKDGPAPATTAQRDPADPSGGDRAATVRHEDR